MSNVTDVETKIPKLVCTVVMMNTYSQGEPTIKLLYSNTAPPSLCPTKVNNFMRECHDRFVSQQEQPCWPTAGRDFLNFKCFPPCSFAFLSTRHFIRS